MLIADAYLLVDGYNVLSSSSEFAQLKDEDLAHARDIFADMLANYAAFKGCMPILVFDAYAVKTPAAIEEKKGVQVVFTGEGETADSYIEKTVYQLLHKNKKVFVVTGDHSEQLTILGMGAYRLTAAELMSDCKKTCKEIAERIVAGRPLSGRQEVAQRINMTVLSQLENLRRKEV